MTSAVRAFSGTAKRAKTSIVFLHFGQPRTEFYAKEFLLKSACNFYNVPTKLEGCVPSSFLVNGKVRKCVEAYGSRVSIEDAVESLSQDVRGSLNELLPEFGEVSCSAAFLYEANTFSSQMKTVMKSGADHIVLFPLFPHYSCIQSGFLLNAATSFIHSTTVPMVRDGKQIDSIRVRPQTDISFEISAVHRWGAHPTVSEVWSNRLLEQRRSYDGIVFCAPAMRGSSRDEYEHSVWASCQRIADNLDNPVPWRLGFYNSWDAWDLPLRNSLGSQIKRMIGKMPNERRVAVVPVADVLPSYDTISVIPRSISKFSKASMLETAERDTVLSQGISEIVKNHLLGRRNAQLKEYCDTCTRRECERTRLLLS